MYFVKYTVYSTLFQTRAKYLNVNCVLCEAVVPIFGMIGHYWEKKL
jgi:hypothetical protein